MPDETYAAAAAASAPAAPAPAAGAARPYPAPEQVTQQASCVLQIDADPVPAPVPYGSAYATFEAATVASLSHSSPVLDAAVRRHVDVNGVGRDWRRWLIVTAAPLSQRFVRVEVSLLKDHPAEIRGDDGRDVAGGVLASVVENLKKTVQESVDAHREHQQTRLARAEAEVEQAKQKLAAVRDRLRKARAATGALTAAHGPDPRNALHHLRAQKQNHEQQLSNYRSRLKTLEPAATPPLVAQWTEIVEMREKQLKEAKGADTADKDAVGAAERKLTEARAQLDAARRASAGESGDARARAAEMNSVRNSIAEAEARLKAVEEQIDRLEDEKVAAAIEELPELQNEESRARTELSDVTARLDQVRRTASNAGGVSLRVLDGKPDEDAREGT